MRGKLDVVPVDRAKELDALRGLISLETGHALANLAAEVPEDQVIVELGSYMGKSTCWLAEGSRRGRGAGVIAVDAWNLMGNVDGKHRYASLETKQVFDEQLKTMDFWETIYAIQDFTAAVGRAYPRMDVGLLFVDADHSYEAVKADFEAWEPHLVERAVVAFDDYGTRKNPGVERFVRELAKRYNWSVIIDPNAPTLAVAHRTG